MRSNIRMTIRPFINNVFSLQATDNQPPKITMHHLPTENHSPEDWNRHFCDSHNPRELARPLLSYRTLTDKVKILLAMSD